MRQIKFRAWSVFTKKWMDETDYKICNCGNIALRTPATNEYVCTKNDMFILVQLTGLFDAKGKEIYEGDILQCPPGVGAVVWRDGCFRISWNEHDDTTLHDTPVTMMEIISNIYSNPELIAKP